MQPALPLAKISCNKCFAVITFLVPGGYSQWSGWSVCSKTCDAGEKKRNRTCNNPLPANGGATCLDQGFGDSEESVPCNETPCPS